MRTQKVFIGLLREKLRVGERDVKVNKNADAFI